MQFRQLKTSRNSEGKYVSEIVDQTTENLPAGDVLIRVVYSSLNYKDALSLNGNKGVTKNYPHTAGIDVAGIVEHSESSFFSNGDKVLVTGYDLGMNTSGGFSEYVRVPADWVVALPEKMSCEYAMQLGTAGLTAALSVDKPWVIFGL